MFAITTVVVDLIIQCKETIKKRRQAKIQNIMSDLNDKQSIRTERKLIARVRGTKFIIQRKPPEIRLPTSL